MGYCVFFADPDGNTLELSYGHKLGSKQSERLILTNQSVRRLFIL